MIVAVFELIVTICDILYYCVYFYMMPFIPLIIVLCEGAYHTNTPVAGV